MVKALKKESFGGGSFYYVVLAELVLHLIANQRSSFIRCIGSSY
nr:MAG TPA: hypothetical protein [Caudoviricetes sp.]